MRALERLQRFLKERSRKSSARRRLQLNVSGRWFVALAIAMGVVALSTGNNTLYLLESLLLSGLILSGVLSERFVSAVDFEVHRAPAIAGSQARDKIKVRNHRRFTVFAMELGEWREGEFHPIAYLPRLAGREATVILSQQKFERRGVHRWDALAVSTSYPFGFAKKIRLLSSPGERVIWPEREPASRSARREQKGEQGRRSGTDVADAEIRAYQTDDDIRAIVWTLSSKGTGPVVRVRRSEQPDPEVTLDLRSQPSGAELEARVRAAAQPFYGLSENVNGGTLSILTRSGKRRIQGRNTALNELAVAS